MRQVFFDLPPKRSWTMSGRTDACRGCLIKLPSAIILVRSMAAVNSPCAGRGQSDGRRPSDLADARARQQTWHNADEITAEIVAKRLVEHLGRAGLTSVLL
jgi:hypothetical protein